jgi:nicotinate-nucleotide adenylyltransferase
MRVGIFGGTFDPPHLGHLILAAEAVQQMRLEKVLWVLTPDPPHKLGHEIRPWNQRLKLVQAAISENTTFEISRVDIDRPGPHYAVDTLDLLAQNNPGIELFYLMGGDSLRDLPTWYRPVDFLKACGGLGVMRRPSSKTDLSALEGLLPGISQRVQFIQAPLIEVSSTDIRERIDSGRTYRYFLPQPVYQIITESCMYTKSQG